VPDDDGRGHQPSDGADLPNDEREHDDADDEQHDGDDDDHEQHHYVIEHDNHLS
jgi:hypothetical protein